jgi:hypothetical protein
VSPAPRAEEPRFQVIAVSLALKWAEEHIHLRGRTWPGVSLFNRVMHHASGSDLHTTTA